MKIYLPSGAWLRINAGGAFVDTTQLGIIKVTRKKTDNDKNELVCDIIPDAIVVYNDNYVQFYPPPTPQQNNVILPDLLNSLEKLDHETLRKLKNKLIHYKIKERKWQTK